MGVEVTITNPQVHGPLRTLRPGEEQAFGRSVGGVGRLGEHREVSRRHGTVAATDSGLAVTSTGTFAGFIVADRATPSRLFIPAGVGPVTVPFADCSIIVELDDGRIYLDVKVTGVDAADRWAAAWGAEMRARADGRTARRRGVTPRSHPPIDDETRGLGTPPAGLGTLRFRARTTAYKSNGKPYAWFRTLVALCEPALGLAPAGTPTNTELARRLYLSEGVIERHLHQIYDAFRIDAERYHRKEVAVELAIGRAIVTRDDLDLLPGARGAQP